MSTLAEDHRIDARRRYDQLPAIDKEYLNIIHPDIQEAHRLRNGSTAHFAIFTEKLERRTWAPFLRRHGYNRSSLRLDIDQTPNVFKRLQAIATHVNETSTTERIKVFNTHIEVHAVIVLAITPI